MKLNKILSFFLALILIFSLTACNTQENVSDSSSAVTQTENNDKNENNNNKSNPLLYKVSDSNGNHIWLFGSIHVGDDYFYPLPEYVTNAFDQSDSLAVEFDITTYEKDLNAQMKSLQAFVYTDGTKISDHLPEKVYNKAKKILKENNLYNSAMDYYIPAFWSSLIDNVLYEKIKVDYELGVDRHMIEKAYKQKKKIHDIESAESQYNMLAGLSDDLQIMMLESSVSSYKLSFLAKYQLKNMMKAWAKGDENELTAQLSAEPSFFMNKEQKALYAEYTQKLITDRNLTMTNWAENALISGEKVFICVGAAHIVGDGAMADLLKNRGYTVEIIR